MELRPMPLTNTAIRNAKPAAKARKLFDGGGLYLEIAPSGGKWWRLKYRFEGKKKRLSVGVYPDVSLKACRTASALDTGLRHIYASEAAQAKARNPLNALLHTQREPEHRGTGDLGRFWAAVVH